MKLMKSDYLFYNVLFLGVVHLFYFVHWLDLKYNLLLSISFYLTSLAFFLRDTLHAMYLFLYQIHSQRLSLDEVLLLQCEREYYPYYNARMLSKLLIAASFQLPTLFALFLGQCFSFWFHQLYGFPNCTCLVSLTNHYQKK